MNKFNGINFDEATNVAYDLWQEEMPSELQEILDNDQTETVNNQFWLLVSAVKRFINQEKRLPISGVVPDMVSTT